MTTDYPSAEEVKEIVARRKQLAQELMGCLMVTNERERNERFKQLMARYGEADVERAIDAYKKGVKLDEREDENVPLYRVYVDYYRRFGGERPFLTLEEYVEAKNEHAQLHVRQELGQEALPPAEEERLAHLSDLLLIEARFWEDLVPDNPPPTMPEVQLPSPEQAVPDVAAGLPSDSYPLCPNDGFPLIEIEGQLRCCVESLDRCIGQQKVVDVVQQDKITYYVFEDDHKLPLLCGCCGRPLQVEDLAQERKQVRGRQLEAMLIRGAVLKEEQRQYDELILEFSKLGGYSKPLHVPVAFEVAAQLIHPKLGHGGQKRTSSKKQARSQRKGRSGKRGKGKKRR